MAKFVIKVTHVENATETETTIDLTLEQKFMFGRGEQNHHRLDDAQLSRSHFYLVWNGEKLCVSDNKSTNGTCLNGMEIKQTQFLNLGDRIEAGLHVVQIVSFPSAPST